MHNSQRKVAANQRSLQNSRASLGARIPVATINHHGGRVPRGIAPVVAAKEDGAFVGVGVA
jgi:hypothetical protein